MNVTSSPGMLGSQTRSRARPAVAWLALGSLVLGSAVAAEEQPAASEQTAAVLKLREVDFYYRSHVALLSCSDLEGRIASILRTLGARDDVKVSATGCDTIVTPLDEPLDPAQMPSNQWPSPTDRWQTRSDRWGTSSDRLRSQGTRREQSTHVRIRAMMPIEVTPEVLEEIRKDKSRRELISRVTGNPAAALNDPIAFPAQRQLVTLSHRTIELEPAECELLDQISTGIFKQLDIRVVRRSSSCDRDQISRIPPQVTVEALMPVFSNPQAAPPAGDSESDPGAPTDPGTPSPEPATATPQQ